MTVMEKIIMGFLAGVVITTLLTPSKIKEVVDGNSKEEADYLKEQLEDAIAKEDYETAATLRDKIKSRKKMPNGKESI